jgi:hypothetical protein
MIDMYYELCGSKQAGSAMATLFHASIVLRSLPRSKVCFRLLPSRNAYLVPSPLGVAVAVPSLCCVGLVCKFAAPPRSFLQRGYLIR